MARQRRPRTDLQTEEKPIAKLGEIGKAGLSLWSGKILEDPMRELRGKEGYRRYNEMRLTFPAAAMLLAIELSIRGADWTFSSDQGEDDERVQFLDEARDGMSQGWNDFITEVLTMLPFGYAPFEEVYKRDERGRLVWRKFAIRGQDTIERWEMDDEGGLSGFWQRVKYQQPAFIPIRKAILFRTRVEKNNPEGRSILRAAWKDYYYLKNIQMIEGIGIERDLAGMPVITLPPGADTTDSETSDLGIARKIVRNVRRDEQEGIVKPSPEWEFELLSTGGTRQFDTDKIIRRYESRVLMSTLAQFLTLGQNSVGTQALSSDLTDLFNVAVDAIADIVAETFTKYAVARLLVLNGYDPEGVRLEHSPAGDIDLAALGDFFQKVGDKITWLATDESWLRSVSGLPQVDPETIDLERQKKRQEAMELFQQRSNAFGNNDRQDERDKDRNQDRDEQGVTIYAADGTAPDDDERRYYERKLNELMELYFADEKRRILRGAEGIKRNAS